MGQITYQEFSSDTLRLYAVIRCLEIISEASRRLSAEEWERKTRRKGTLADFLAASPLRDSGIEIERLKGGFRDVDV